MKKLLLLLTLFSVTFNTLTAQNWEKYKAEDLDLVAYFPDEPTRSVQKVNTAVGELDMHMIMYTSETNDNMVYSVIRSDYPKAQFVNSDQNHKTKVLDGAVDGAVKNVQGEIVFHNKVTFNGYPGRNVKIAIDGAYLYINAYLIENSMYITQVICVNTKDKNSSINRFLNSFEVIKTR